MLTIASSDFTPNTCTLVFPAGSGPGTAMDCTFAINDDNEVESTIETINLVASEDSGGVASFAPGRSTATINIVDNDGKKQQQQQQQN